MIFFCKGSLGLREHAEFLFSTISATSARNIFSLDAVVKHADFPLAALRVFLTCHTDATHTSPPESTTSALLARRANVFLHQHPLPLSIRPRDELQRFWHREIEIRWCD
ncbi:MAG: hypothetical protein MUF64_06250, partial [Polyangiaceae bacterium]|nr:hypothetical protein [Polyangiaceae bacterium]